MQPFTLLDICIIAGVLLLIRRILSVQSRPPVPPGPKPWPVIGNLFDMPSSYAWKTFTAWASTYGPIIHLRVFAQPIVVLNSAQAAQDLLDRRSRTYSDRPMLQMGGEVLGWSRSVVIAPSGPRHRAHRRMFHRFLGSRANLARHHGMVELETHRFARRVLERPEAFVQHIRLTAGAIILMISHGYAIREHDDPFIDAADKATDHFAESTKPGAFLVDTFPILRFVPEWFPGGGWKKIAREWLVDMNAMVDMPHAYVKDRMADGTALPSFTSFYMRNGQVSAEEEDNIKWASSSIMSGGSDTSVSSIHSFFLAMTLYPEVQRKAQAELDAVIGRDRLPSLSDSEQLPYINALVKEVFRWNPVGPVGLPHRLMEDDEYEGYLIPKGSIVFANIWKFLHDEEVYHDPLEFIPDRFIASEGKEAELDPHGFSFGFGRRVCPGMFLADLSVFSACAMILAAFDISKAVENGVTIEPKVEYTDGSISHPKPFKCSIKPRSEQAVSLVSSVRFSDEE